MEKNIKTSLLKSLLFVNALSASQPNSQINSRAVSPANQPQVAQGYNHSATMQQQTQIKTMTEVNTHLGNNDQECLKKLPGDLVKFLAQSNQTVKDLIEDSLKNSRKKIDWQTLPIYYKSNAFDLTTFNSELEKKYDKKAFLTENMHHLAVYLGCGLLFLEDFKSCPTFIPVSIVAGEYKFHNYYAEQIDSTLTPQFEYITNVLRQLAIENHYKDALTSSKNNREPSPAPYNPNGPRTMTPSGNASNIT